MCGDNDWDGCPSRSDRELETRPVYELHNWSCSIDNPYTPPEAVRKFLRGQVVGHERYNDYEWVGTSYIKEVIGRVIITSSGSHYRLMEPNPEYIQFLKDNNLRLPTETEPISFINGDNDEI